MNDLRKYIDLISNSETLSERRGRSRNRNKNKNKNKPNKKPLPQNQPPKPPAPTPPVPPKSKREAIKNLIKNNPKAAKALGVIAGLSAIPYVSDKVRQPTTPDQSGQGADGADARQQSQQQTPSQDEIAALKAKIDAMIKELEPSTDPAVKKELERIKQKLSGATTNQRTGQPQPNYSSSTGSARDYYNRSINFLDRIPNQ
jgi:hypothetical protein